MQNGWPQSRHSMPPVMYGYWKIQDEIYEENGLLFIGDQILMPRKIRAEMLAKLHESHLGIDKCKSRAKDTMYWPNINQDNKDTVKCSICAKFRRANEKLPMISHEIPIRPWAKLGMDIFHFGGHEYLVVVDFFSKYPEVAHLKNKTANGVITVLKEIFAIHGIPEETISDNMPFASSAFKAFAKE